MTFRPSVGDKARLDPSADVVLLCNNKATLDRFLELAVAGDKTGISILVLQHRAFLASGGTSVLVIGREFNSREVRIEEGDLLGRSGWIGVERLKPAGFSR